MVCFGGGMITTMNDELAHVIDGKTAGTQPSDVIQQLFCEFPGFLYSTLEMLLSRKPVFIPLVFPALYLLNQYDRDMLDDFFEESPVTAQHMGALPAGRFSPLSAALGCSQLDKIDRLNKMRRKRAHYLLERLSHISGLILPASRQGVYHTYLCFALGVDSASRTARKLLMRGVDVRRDYITSLTGQYTDRVLYLPNHPALNKADLDWIVRCIPECL